MFSNKKYIKSLNAKGIFDNTYETRLHRLLRQKSYWNTLKNQISSRNAFLSVGTVVEQTE